MQCAYQVFMLLGGLIHQIWCESNVAACWRTYFSNLFSLFNQLTKIAEAFCSSTMCWICYIISAQLSIDQNSNAQTQWFIFKEEIGSKESSVLKLHETLFAFSNNQIRVYIVLRCILLVCVSYRHILRFLNFDITYCLGVIPDFLD